HLFRATQVNAALTSLPVLAYLVLRQPVTATVRQKRRKQDHWRASVARRNTAHEHMFASPPDGIGPGGDLNARALTQPGPASKATPSPRSALDALSDTADPGSAFYR